MTYIGWRPISAMVAANLLSPEGLGSVGAIYTPRDNRIAVEVPATQAQQRRVRKPLPTKTQTRVTQTHENIEQTTPPVPSAAEMLKVLSQ